MNQKISPGAMAGIVIVVVLIAVGLGWYMINRPPSDVPAPPMKMGAGNQKMELPKSNTGNSPTGTMAPSLPGGGGGGMTAPTLPGGGGGMTAPSTPR